MQPDQVHNEEAVDIDQPECYEPVYSEDGRLLNRQDDFWEWHNAAFKQIFNV